MSINTRSSSNKVMIPGKVICTYNETTYLIGVTWKQLIDNNIEIVNWKYNRPYDPLRIKEIAKTMITTNYVDGIIYIVCNDTDPENIVYECYDGIHRIETMKYLQTKYSDVNHKILIHYTSEYNESEIKVKFEALNKCVPVPEIYSNAARQLDMIQKMEFISSHYITLYPNHFSGNKKTNIPNENRDIFIDKISQFIKENRLESLTNENIIQIIDRYNNVMKENCKFYKLTKKQYDKCVKHNCFLFISKRWDLSLEKLYQNQLLNYSNNL
jgi:hypothetical protein